MCLDYIRVGRNGHLSKHPIPLYLLNTLQVISLSHEQGQFAEWKSFEETKTKYGLAQMQSMVRAGTLKYRQMPSDPRFYEFRCLTEQAWGLKVAYLS